MPSLAYSCTTSISVPVLMWSSSLGLLWFCISISHSFLLLRYQSLDLGPTYIQYDLALTNYRVKDHISKIRFPSVVSPGHQFKGGHYFTEDIHFGTSTPRMLSWELLFPHRARVELVQWAGHDPQVISWRILRVLNWSGSLGKLHCVWNSTHGLSPLGCL